MRFLDAFNEVLELAIPFGQEPRHKVHPARGIVSARWRISDFLADFEFMKHVQLAAPCLRSSRNVSFAPPPVAAPVLGDGRLVSPGPPIPRRGGPRPSRREPTETFIYFAGWR